MNSNLSVSDLDEQRFGVRTAKGILSSDGQVSELLEFMQNNGCELGIVRVKSEDLALVQRLEDAGARLCDSLLYYRRAVRAEDVFAAQANGYRYRLATPHDAAEIAALARVSFSGYAGHYHADPRLPKEKADAVYYSWAERSCTTPGVADRVFVVVREQDNEMAAFATIGVDVARREMEGVLFGVSPNHQGHGIYRQLIRNTLGCANADGYERMVVSTQVTNLAVQKVWVREGFEPHSSYYTLHLWLPLGQKAV